MAPKQKRQSFKAKVLALLEKKGLHELKEELGLKKPEPRVKLTKWQSKKIEERLQAGQVVAMQLAQGGVKLIHPQFVTIAKRFRYEDPSIAKADRDKFVAQQQKP